MTKRLFVALRLEDAIREHLSCLQKQLLQPAAFVRWLAPSSLHLTLKFLGETPEEFISEIQSRLEHVAIGFSPYKFTVEKTGAFPNKGPVRIVWTGVSDGAEETIELAAGVKEELKHFGKEENKNFSPHITIGRVKEDHSNGALRRQIAETRLSPISQQIASVVLYESKLLKSGAIYNNMGEFRFAK